MEPTMKNSSIWYLQVDQIKYCLPSTFLTLQFSYLLDYGKRHKADTVIQQNGFLRSKKQPSFLIHDLFFVENTFPGNCASSLFF